MKDVEKRLDIKNMSDRIRHKMCCIFVIKNLTEKQGKQYVRSKNEIDKNLKNNLFKYSRSDITEQIIKNCRGVKQCNDGVNRQDKENQRENLRQLLGFKRQKIIEQYRVGKYFIDLFFPVHKLGIEIDENRPKKKRKKRLIKKCWNYIY